MTLCAEARVVPESSAPIDGRHLLRIDQLVGGVDGDLRRALRVGDDGHQLLAAQDAALGIHLVDRELGRIQHRRHEIGHRPGDVEEQADLDLVIGGLGRDGGGDRRGGGAGQKEFSQ